MPSFDIVSMLYTLPALLIGLTFHELSHGLVAYMLGDSTAKDQGRLTLNPIKHLDPLGAFFLLFFHFGWAKPVPINPFHFKGDRKRGVLLVSLAGPGSNLVMALITALIWRLLGPIGDVLSTILYYIIYINLILAVFNLIPVPPLDGSKILAGILPYRYSHYIYNLEKYGIIILLFLSFTGFIGKIMMPAIDALMNLVFALVGMKL